MNSDQGIVCSEIIEPETAPHAEAASSEAQSPSVFCASARHFGFQRIAQRRSRYQNITRLQPSQRCRKVAKAQFHTSQQLLVLQRRGLSMLQEQRSGLLAA